MPRARGAKPAVEAERPTLQGRGLDAAMAHIGDRWSLLVVDALLARPRRFSELEGAIPGLAPNVLAARLRRLEEIGLIDAVPYQERPLRLEYQVTPKARALAGALALLASWGASGVHGPSEAPRHARCGGPLEARWYCPTCGELAEAPEEDLTWL